MSWSIQEGASGGTVSTAGFYTPPDGEGTFQVIATSNADPGKSASAVVTVNRDLVDHGGRIVSSARVFALWWGDTTEFASDARSVLENVVQGLGGSEYLAVIDQYMRGATASVSFGGHLYDPGTPPPDAPSNTDVAIKACMVLWANGITPTWGDIVLVNTANFPGDISGFCAWHSWAFCNGAPILTAYIPNAAKSICGYRPGPDPCNGATSAAAAALGHSVSHEIVEAMTDPYLTAWYARSVLGEVADMCSGYGRACASLSTGTFSIGQLYSNSAHSCVSK